jgi:rare lipoprotein A
MKKLIWLIILLLYLFPLSTIKAYENVSVSWYGQTVCNRKKNCRTANGEVFNENDATTACPLGFPFNTLFHVVYGDNQIVVRCNDRGGFKKYGRFLDLSKSSFAKLAPNSRGIIKVQVEVVK